MSIKPVIHRVLVPLGSAILISLLVASCGSMKQSSLGRDATADRRPVPELVVLGPPLPRASTAYTQKRRVIIPAREQVSLLRPDGNGRGGEGNASGTSAGTGGGASAAGASGGGAGGRVH